jgi:pSer/pThr/pTyr-binding forkhead associated (FHA) protein
MNAVIVFSLRLVLILISYLFVGWIGYTIYSDHQGRHGIGREAFPPITLKASINHQTQEKKFNNSENIIGRDPAVDFPLSEETVSLRHCKISYHHKKWWAEDLGSTNGSYLNDHLLEAATVITNGDELRLGQVKLSITID